MQTVRTRFDLRVTAHWWLFSGHCDVVPGQICALSNMCGIFIDTLNGVAFLNTWINIVSHNLWVSVLCVRSEILFKQNGMNAIDSYVVGVPPLILYSLAQSPAIATQHFFSLFSHDARTACGQSEISAKKCWVAIAGDCTCCPARWNIAEIMTSHYEVTRRDYWRWLISLSSIW